MRTPANQPFIGQCRRLGDALMGELPLWHMADPASDQTPIRPSHAQHALLEQRPEVGQGGGRQANQYR
ncbi:hypothetical protein D3C76_1743980 [compost metagenome]